MTSLAVGRRRPTITTPKSAPLPNYQNEHQGSQSWDSGPQTDGLQAQKNLVMCFSHIHAPFKPSNLILIPFSQPTLCYHIMGQGRGAVRRSITFNSKETKLCSILNLQYQVCMYHLNLLKVSDIRFIYHRLKFPKKILWNNANTTFHTQSECGCCLLAFGVGRISPKPDVN